MKLYEVKALAHETQSQLKYADKVADINLRSDRTEPNEIKKQLKLHQRKI